MHRGKSGLARFLSAERIFESYRTAVSKYARLIDALVASVFHIHTFLLSYARKHNREKERKERKGERDRDKDIQGKRESKTNMFEYPDDTLRSSKVSPDISLTQFCTYLRGFFLPLPDAYSLSLPAVFVSVSV